MPEKIGPKEQMLRDQRERRAEQEKREVKALRDIDKHTTKLSARTIGKVGRVKASSRGNR